MTIMLGLQPVDRMTTMKIVVDKAPQKKKKLEKVKVVFDSKELL